MKSIRRKLLVLPLLLCLSPLFSQTGLQEVKRNNYGGPSSKHELGVDMIYFLSLASGDLIGGSPSPYFLNYRKYCNNGALRVGFGFDFASRKVEEDTVLQRQRNNRYNLRAGYEWQRNFGKRWQIHYGADVYLDWLRQSNSESFPDRRDVNEVRSVGAGPHLGVKLKLNERLWLGTETNFVFSYSNIRQTRADASGVFRNTRFTQLETDFIHPYSVFLLLRI